VSRNHVNKIVDPQILDIVQTLMNLNYLICEAADRPAEVRHFSSITGERLHAMEFVLKETCNQDLTVPNMWKC
jgi:hypothetical protein